MNFVRVLIFEIKQFTTGFNGKFTLPDEIVERYQFKKETQFRIVPTQKGVLLIPLTDEPMNNELKSALEEWQSVSENAWGNVRF